MHARGFALRVAASGRATLGLAGLLAFELILLAYLWSFGSTSFVLVGAGMALALAYAILEVRRGRGVPAWALAAMAALTLARALLQTQGGFRLALVPSYAVPLGFALAAYGRARAGVAGIALVAAARTWFIAWYFMNGATTIALANVLGAIGAWVWLSGEIRPEAEAAQDAPVAVP